MCTVRSTIAGVVLLAVLAHVAIAADTWNVENNFDRDFKLVITPAGGTPTEYELKAGETVPIRPNEDPHTFVTSLATGEQQQLHSQKRLRKVADAGLTSLKQVRSPIGISMPDGTDIYQAMPDYPYSKKYEVLIDDVRESSWSGTYNGKPGKLTLSGNKGSADDKTKLNNIQYVPSDKQLVIAGEWQHKGENGEFILIIDQKSRTQLKGHYRTGDGNWRSGTATRTNGN